MRHILLAATALVLLSGGAYAQSSNANSGSSSTAVNSSGSQSTSVSNPRVNVIGNPIGNGASSSYSGARASANTRSNSRSASVGNSTTVNVSGYAGVDGSGNSSAAASAGGSGGTAGGPTDPNYGVNYSGSYTVRNTPEVIPPSIVGGNACAVGASAGMSMAGFGIAGGATWADKQCERRQQAALLFNMGEQQVALALMCQDDNVRAAMRVGGKPCTGDVPVAAVAPAPVAQAVAPAPAARAVSVAAAAPAKPARPEWCYTASRAELRAHPVCSLKS
jgi:hypothetical protein